MAAANTASSVALPPQSPSCAIQVEIFGFVVVAVLNSEGGEGTGNNRRAMRSIRSASGLAIEQNALAQGLVHEGAGLLGSAGRFAA